MLSPFDEPLLRAADALVLFVWNRLGLPRIKLIRVGFILCIVGEIAWASGRNHVTAGHWFLGAVLLIGLTAEEWMNARCPPRLANAILLTHRGSLPHLVTRGVSAGLFALAAALSPDVGSAVLGLLLIPLMYLCRSLHPEEPPRKPKRETAGPWLRTPVKVRG